MAATVEKWQNLPSVIITQVLSKLPSEDRLKTSTICKSWRSCLFHKILWDKRTFQLKNGKLKKSKQIVQLIGRYLDVVNFEFEAQNINAVVCFIKILETFAKSVNLQNLTLLPSSCHLSLPSKNRQQFLDQLLEQILKIIRNSRNLKHLSLGCVTDLCEKSAEIVHSIEIHQSKTIQSLHLASIREIPHMPSLSEPLNSLCCFKHLQILGVDYDQLSDDIIIEFSRNHVLLKRLNLHIHSVEFNKPLISYRAWRIFASRSTNLQMNCTIIHSQSAASSFRDILPPFLPIYTLRLLFNDYLTVAMITYIKNFSRTLRSLQIIDGIDDRPKVYNQFDPNAEDPFVMLAWQCSKLRHLTVIGYLLIDEYVVAIARLRGSNLKTLTIAQCCIGIESEQENEMDLNILPYDEYFNEEVSRWMKVDWRPIQDFELHPSIIDPLADAETAYLHLLLSDQRI